MGELRTSSLVGQTQSATQIYSQVSNTCAGSEGVDRFVMCFLAVPRSGLKTLVRLQAKAPTLHAILQGSDELWSIGLTYPAPDNPAPNPQ
jgi:hypothetical protein